MKLLVPVKRVVDYNVKVRVRADGTGVETAGVKMSMNPFDEIAVEEAVRLKEKGVATEIVAISMASRNARRRSALRSRWAPIAASWSRRTRSCSRSRSRSCCARSSRRSSRGLIIMGKQAIDDDMNATGQMLAALLGWPQGTFASKVEIAGDTATVTREVDGGLETVALNLPAIVTTDLRLNEPRYASLPNIMKARKKPIATIKPGRSRRRSRAAAHSR